MGKPYDEKVKIGYDRMLRVKELLDLEIIDTPKSDMFLMNDEDKLNKDIIYLLVTLNSLDYETIKSDIVRAKDSNLKKEEIIENINLFLKEKNELLEKEVQDLGINLYSLHSLDSPYIEKNSSSSSVWAKYYVNNPLDIDKEMFNVNFNIYKVYASFDSFDQLNKENIEQILNDLGGMGFRGAFKVISDTSRLNSSDQMCFYSNCSSNQKLVYEYLSNLEKMNEVSCGIDSGIYSFSMSLATGEFFKYTGQIEIENRQDLIREFIDCIDTKELAKYVKLDEENLMTVTRKNLKTFSTYEDDSKYFFVKRFFESLDKQDLSKDYLYKFKDFLMETRMFQKKICYTEDYIENHLNQKINWEYLFKTQNFSIEFLDGFKNNSDTFGKDISQNPYLTIEIVDKFKDEIDFSLLSKNTNLSLDIINKYKNFLDFNEISSNSNLTYDFIKENIDNLDIYKLALNKDLSPEIKKNIREEFSKLFELEDMVKNFEYSFYEEDVEVIIKNIDNFTLNQLEKLMNDCEENDSIIEFFDSNDFKGYKQLKINYDLIDLKEKITNDLIDIQELPKEIIENKLFVSDLILSGSLDIEQLPQILQQDDLLLKLDEIRKEKDETIGLVD